MKWKLDKSDPGNDPLQLQWSVAAELELIDGLFDWERFDRFLRWLDTPGGNGKGHASSMLFRALLLRHWKALIAAEFEQEVEDRLSFRKFIGLAPRQDVPTYAAVSDFQRLLYERGVAAELFSELHQEIDKHRTVLAEAAENGKHRTLLSMAVEAGPPGPPEWLELESRFVAHWHGKCNGGRVPSSEHISLADLKEFDRNLVLVRVLGEAVFRYEAVGADVAESNGGTLVGRTIGDIRHGNVRKYGHPGLQGELQRTYQLATTQMRPVSVSAYYMNLQGERCQVWTTQAPVADRSGKIDLLTGVALVKPLTIN